MTFCQNGHELSEITPRCYINKMVDTYVRLFGMKPSTKPLSPLEKRDHPEINNSEFLDGKGTQTYQSLVGALQWSISIGGFDIAMAVMTMSSFRAQPHIGHLECIKRICGFLYKMKDAAICIRTGEPDYSGLDEEQYDWANTVYGDISKILPKDAPVPLGNYVMLSHYVDDNLYHDMLTIFEKSYLFGDNKSVVDSSTKPHLKLHKRHNALSFHQVHEAVVSKMFLALLRSMSQTAQA